MLQEAVLELYELRDASRFRSVSGPLFKRVIPSDYFTWFEPEPPGPSTSDHRRWESPARATETIWRRMNHLMATHPFTQHVLSTGDLGPLRLSDFWSPREIRNSEHYRQVFRHVGIGRLLGMVVLRGSISGTLTLARPLTARDFSERDRTMLRLLAPHFAQALELARLATRHGSASREVLREMGLTARESEVANWISVGKSNAEIAVILTMKPRTVEKHVENILGKLGVENRTSAAHVVLGTSAAAPLRPRLGGTKRTRQAVQRLLSRPVDGVPRRAARGARPKP